jgi:hypothetical protein
VICVGYDMVEYHPDVGDIPHAYRQMTIEKMFVGSTQMNAMPQLPREART